MDNMNDRKEWLQFCKNRANEYLDRDNLSEAWASFYSDMQKHPELIKHPKLTYGIFRFVTADFTVESMRKFINGFE